MPIVDSLKFIEIIRDDVGVLNATPNDVLTGKIFVGKSKKIEHGNIPVINQLSNISLFAGENFIIPVGYNTTEYTIYSKSLSEQTVGNIRAEDILINKVAWSNGRKVTGTMDNNGSVSRILDNGESYTISKGYHDGTGIISTVSLSQKTSGNATENEIILGKTAWVNGVKITGTIEPITSRSVFIAPGETYTIPKGYHDGFGNISATTLASNTAGNATNADLILHKTAWVNGVKVTGTIPVIADVTYDLPMNSIYTIPEGYHSGAGRVYQSIETLTEIKVTPSHKSQTIKTAGKFMIDDIIVNAVDAMNYVDRDRNNFIASKSISSNIVVKPSGGNFVYSDTIVTIPVDNWHDNASNNLYNIVLKHNDKKLLSGNIFMYNLFTSNIEDVNKLIYKAYNWEVVITGKLNPGTSAHVIDIEVISSSNTLQNFTGFDIQINEIFTTRKFGYN